MFNNKSVVVYGRSTPPCGFCTDLKKLFDSKNVSYEYKDISDEEDYMEYCKYRLKTVPAVFVEGEFIGGFSEVSKLA